MGRGGEAKAKVAALFLHEPNRWFSGYEISRRVKARSGLVYPALTDFIRRGWVRDDWEKVTGRPPRRLYRVTRRGWVDMKDEWQDYLTQQVRSSPEFAATYEDVGAVQKFIDSLKERREQADLTMDEVAERGGFTVLEVAAIEQEGSDPTLSTLQAYARALDLKVVLRAVDVHVEPGSRREFLECLARRVKAVLEPTDDLDWVRDILTDCEQGLEQSGHPDDFDRYGVILGHIASGQGVDVDKAHFDWSQQP